MNNEKKTFKVKITEEYVREVEIEAEDAFEAEQIAEDRWNNNELQIVTRERDFGVDDFEGAHFEAFPVPVKEFEKAISQDVQKHSPHIVIRGNVLIDCADKGMKKLDIPNVVTKIGKYAVCNCSNLESITLPDSVTEIQEGAFYGCTGLKSITLPEGLKEIGKSAFFGCSNLESIEIPDSVKHIGKNAFTFCTSLDELNVPQGCIVGGGNRISVKPVRKGAKESAATKFVVSYNTLKHTTDREAKHINIPKGIQTIGKYALAYCENLESVTIPDTVTYIGLGAFEGCINLKEVAIPDTVTYIGHDAFAYCDKLKNITVSSKCRLNYIGCNAEIIRRGDPEKKPSLKDKIAGAQKKADEHNAGSTQPNIDDKKLGAR